MTIANTFASKLFVGFVAIAMMVTLAAPAQAATEEELQAQIDSLMATINALQSQVGQGATNVASGICPYAWTRSLSQGSTGGDVMKLQQFLNADPGTTVSVSGAGSVGAETEYYGPATAAAVSKFQVMYADSILTPLGLANGTGYFGPSTMAKANSLCTSAPVADDTMDDDSDDSSDDSDYELSGEGSLGDSDLKDGDDTDLEEGQEDAPVAELELTFENGDVLVKRIDVSLDQGTDDQWDTFETVSLWVDGDKVAEKDADSKGDYLGDEDDGILRFSGLNILGMEDEELTIVIAVTVQTGLDTVPDTWEVDVLNVRYTDADDVTSTDTLTLTETDFEIEAEGADDEVIIKSSSDDPDATTLQLDETKKSDYMTIFAFDIDTDDSTNDIEVNEIVVDVDSTEDGTIATSTALLVNDAMLVIDGEEYDDVTITVSGSRFTFDIDGDLVIDAGDRVTVEFQAEFLKLASTLEGATVQGEFVSIDAEGADDITATGAAQGDEHTLRTSGAVVEVTSTTETTKTNAADDTSDDEGVFTIKFDVTAFETDLFVTKSAASGTANSVGVNYIVQDSAGNQVGLPGAGTTTAALSSTAKTEGGKYKVNEGETKSFTLTVNFDPATTDFYQVQVYALNWSPTSGGAVTQQLTVPVEDFQTDAISVNN